MFDTIKHKNSPEEYLVEKSLQKFAERGMPVERIQKYVPILQWMNQRVDELKSPGDKRDFLVFTSYVARAYHELYTLCAAMKFQSKYRIQEIDEWDNIRTNYLQEIKNFVKDVKNIKKPNDRAIHATYFLLQAISDIEGNRFQKKDFTEIVNWICTTQNKDKGYWYDKEPTKPSVEATATAIHTLALLSDNKEIKPDIIKTIKNGLEYLTSNRCKSNGWGANDNGDATVHHTSHVIRALIAIEPFLLEERNNIMKLIKDTLEWLKNTQVGKDSKWGWGTHENDKTLSIEDTALGFIALHNIQNYNPSWVPYYSRYVVNTVDYLWNEIKDDHWTPGTSVIRMGGDLQFTALITRELAAHEMWFKDISYNSLIKSINDTMLDKIIIEKREVSSSNFVIITRIITLLSTFICLIFVINKVVNFWAMLERCFRDKPLLSGIIAALIASIIIFLIRFIVIKKKFRKLKKMLSEYLGLDTGN